MKKKKKEYDFFIYTLILITGVVVSSWFEPMIGETAVTVIQVILFCICAPIIIWMRWKNRRMDKQNEDN
ncbi:hypothetical protein [Listeria booriae]|uniref:Uncharacterized protein n=1 Tax=Listeria booriae TaxID=1552123 RepID=A0A7X1A541_9LIST|nr:hypothetical protein [Listeria booriae]MBC1574007.1 hypothetical protein [Listeria booriae]MBC2371437.1 hypothetical protein [Listeria booriae]MBC2675433.1 hypothetical protein [Listeria booriae]